MLFPERCCFQIQLLLNILVIVDVMSQKIVIYFLVWYSEHNLKKNVQCI